MILKITVSSLIDPGSRQVGDFTRVIESPSLRSLNMKGPVPIGCLSLVAADFGCMIPASPSDRL